MVTDKESDVDYCRSSELKHNIGSSKSNISRAEYLVCLAKTAGRELRQLINIDNRQSQKSSHHAPLVNYNPQEDWESSSSVVKLFIDELLNENNTDLLKVTFRNMIFIGSHSRNIGLKPQGCYFISATIKYSNDRQKILDILSNTWFDTCYPV